MVMTRKSLALIALVMLAACGGPEPSAPPAAATAGPTEVIDTRDGFHLILRLPAATFLASEPVTGEAVLTSTDGHEAEIGGSGSGPITFAYEEIGGTRSMSGVSDTDCSRYKLTADDGFRSGLRPAGAWSEDDPNADFYRDFAQSTAVRLPAGAWRITARASFVDWPCAPPVHDLEASTVIVVAP
jgi:hypothetical protein